MEFSLKVFIITASIYHVRSYNDVDLVNNLPGLKTNISFRMHSGFLNGLYKGHKLHYIFVESQNDYVKDPVVLWLNGGPGCSSMEGYFAENGPFKVDKNGGGSLKENKFSWNKISNMLYLDSPVGVGFSYIEGSTNHSTNDLRTTNDSYSALLSFFEKYPELKDNELYLTGESYGGIYIPLLSKKVSEEGVLNLKVSRLFTNFTKTCCMKTQVMKQCNVFQPVECRQTILAKNVLYFQMLGIDVGPINMYNVFSRCALTQTFKIGNESLPSAVPCVDSSYLEKYMNNAEVQKALNMPSSGGKIWRMCSLDLNAEEYKRTYKSTEGIIRELVNKNIRGYIINGDADSVCNFLGNEWSFDNLNLKLTEDRNYYTVNGQVGGFTKASGNIRFATVKLQNKDQNRENQSKIACKSMESHRLKRRSIFGMDWLQTKHEIKLEQITPELVISVPFHLE
ncbi:Lysosomal protective protein [Nymphon striatum]|nr:Lysosomal protective protein [Nymphon striatum]